MSTLKPIPGPPGYPIVGNIFDIGPDFLETLAKFAEEYGEIFTLNILGRHIVLINSVALAQEVCDERRFHKGVARSPLEQIRSATGDSLFTAYHGEENWGVAHRILVPAFGPVNIMSMFDDMYDILSQLVLKWERFGPQHEIDPADDFTRLAFDTIALCTMSYRLNSFYTEGVPPFVEAMGSFLAEAGKRSRRPPIVQHFKSEAKAKFEADKRQMLDLVQEILEDRKASPGDRKDLLNSMLNGIDPQTGKSLTDESIMQQAIVFLIAGHETTSGFLSFLMYYVLKHPDVYKKLRAEVDAVVGAERMRPEHLARLPYMQAVMRETMRVKSTIPIFALESDEDQVLAGKYLVKKGTNILMHINQIHRDTTVYGEDAKEFKPERMLDGKFEALPPKAWVPFGNGKRACIGRSFAWQEAQMAITTLFQKFDFSLADPDYALKINSTLTIKPKGLRIRATPRTDTTFTLGLAPVVGAGAKRQEAPAQKANAGAALKPMHVRFGSNTGSCEMFAQRLASDAASYGFGATIGTLDSLASQIPVDGPVIIVTASFEGEPPDNAARFVNYIETLPGENAPFAGVRYAVFGCGNHDWVHTYQRIPTLVDATLAAKGAERLLARGEADAAGEGFFESFDNWEAKLWPALVEAFGAVASSDFTAGLDVKVSAPTKRASTLRQEDAQMGTLTVNTLLTKPGATDKHHLEFMLPEGMSYRAGDYLAILPTNPMRSVKRVLAHFNLTPEQEISIQSTGPTTLPVGRPVNAVDLFSGYVELAQPATRKNIETLLHYTPSTGNTRESLQAMLTAYVSVILEKRISILHILEAHTDIALPLSIFIGLLPAMRVRQYSISSSPLWDPTRVTLTIGVLRDAAHGDSHELFQGVASTYLASLAPGDRVQMAVRPSASAFHLPADPATPIVMFSSGSGIAPMRGFMQERAVQKASGHHVGKALLFYGCRHPAQDFLYCDAELKTWIAQGVVDVRPAFSRAVESSDGCRYVQDRVFHDRQDVIAAFEQGAKFFTCGSGRVAAGVKDACMKIIEELVESGEHSKVWNLETNDAITADALWAKIVNERYAADVFG